MRRRWTWVALSLFVICMVVTIILSVADGSFQQEPASFLALLVGVSAFMVVGALIVATDPATPSAGSSRPSGCRQQPGHQQGKYLTYAYWTRSGSLPDPILVAWALLGGT